MKTRTKWCMLFIGILLVAKTCLLLKAIAKGKFEINLNSSVNFKGQMGGDSLTKIKEES